VRTSVAKIWTKFKLCVPDPEEHEINFVQLFPTSCVCNGPPKLHYWACQSATMAMHGCSWAEVVFLTCTVLTRQHAACASKSDSITLSRPVSPRNLNAACLCVKVEPITILTESPALNWPCAVFASRRYNAIRCHGRDQALGARTHAQELPPPVRACVRGQGTQRSGRGRNTRGAALGSTDRWVRQLVAGKVQTNRVSIARLITVK